MWTPQAAVPLLLLVMIPVPGESVKFPMLLETISDCVTTQCSMKIQACEKLHGEAPTPQLKGCVAKSCRETMIGCMDWIPKAVLAARLSQTQVLPREYMKNILDTTIEAVVDSYLYCFRSTDLQNSTQSMECLLGNVLDRVEPYIKLWLGILGFPDTDLLMCFVRKWISSIASCMNDIDKDYHSQLVENIQREMDFNPYDYISCAAVSFRQKECFPMFSRIYGSTPALETQSKGLFVCVMNGLVVSAAAC
ncbi:uncharacterized protein LOC125806092 [Astyanax mexicanus]|uniref:uncharacterized protein LOC125806092 n=1 Tax=Astyanax mexicanus TaxID=7994 RepID=UPI0020CB57B6|nr:uncharacterized protein LOC125806092 [Astyanax mexicanus]